MIDPVEQILRNPMNHKTKKISEMKKKEIGTSTILVSRIIKSAAASIRWIARFKDLHQHKTKRA